MPVNEPITSRPRRRIVEIGNEETGHKTAEDPSHNLHARTERVRQERSMIDEYVGIAFWEKRDRSTPGLKEFFRSPLARCSRLIFQCLRDGNIEQAELELGRLEELFEQHTEHMAALETRNPEASTPRERLRDAQWMAWELNRRINQVRKKLAQAGEKDGFGDARRLNEEESAQLETIAARCKAHLLKCTSIIPKTASEGMVQPLEQNERALAQLVTVAEQALGI